MFWDFLRQHSPALRSRCQPCVVLTRDCETSCCVVTVPGLVPALCTHAHVSVAAAAAPRSNPKVATTWCAAASLLWPPQSPTNLQPKPAPQCAQWAPPPPSPASTTPALGCTSSAPAEAATLMRCVCSCALLPVVYMLLMTRERLLSCGLQLVGKCCRFTFQMHASPSVHVCFLLRGAAAIRRQPQRRAQVRVASICEAP